MIMNDISQSKGWFPEKNAVLLDFVQISLP